jgi:hypothetical protein
MKSSLIALIVAATLGLGSAAHAGGLFTYSNADIYGGYGCGLSGSVALGGPSANVVGTAYFDPAGNGYFSASTITLNIGGVGTCNYSLVSGDGTYNINPNGTGLAQTLYNLQSGSATNCPPHFGGTLSFVCSEGQFPLTCNVATVDATGSSLLSGTCKKQFLLQVH